MDLWSLTWTMMSCCLAAFSLEVTVRISELLPCDEDERVCVSDPGDCRTPSLSGRETLNMTCYYQNPLERTAAMTCGWTQESDSDLDVSLIFTSRNKVFSCRGIFNPAATLNVTARIRNHRTGSQIWSRPHSLFLFHAIKPPQPVLTVLGSTEDSLVLSWRSSVGGSCWLRYRPAGAATWTQVLDSVPVRAGQTVKYTVSELQPLTEYRAAAACRGRFGVPSDWSAATGTTLDRAPSRPSHVCYHLEEAGPGASPLLQLMWKAPDPESRIHGYEVSVGPDGKTENVTEVAALLVLEEGNCTVSVRAFNSAGFGPAAQLRINTHRQMTLPSVRNLWVSSSYPGNKTLLVQWMLPPPPSSAPPLSHIAVRWRSEQRPSSSRWSRVDGAAISTVIPDLDPEESYMVSVFPVYDQQAGSPRSLPASLQQGALMEAVGLQVVSVTKTTVTVGWAWRRRSGPIRVEGYSVMLRSDSELRPAARVLWPDQQQLTFYNLPPNTQYSLLLLADDVARTALTVATEFDEVPTVATVIPLLLLAITMTTVSILSRTVYKSYVFLPVPSPRRSSVGRWLMHPDRKNRAEPRILDLNDFQDLLGENSEVIVMATDRRPSDPRLDEDTPPPVRTSAFKLDTLCVSEAQPITERPGRWDPETRRDAAASPPPSPRGADGYVPQRSAPAATHHDVMADSHADDEMISFLLLRKLEAETDCSCLVCDDEYLSNSCFRAETTEEETTVSL